MTTVPHPARAVLNHTGWVLRKRPVHHVPLPHIRRSELRQPGKLLYLGVDLLQVRKLLYAGRCGPLLSHIYDFRRRRRRAVLPRQGRTHSAKASVVAA